MIKCISNSDHYKEVIAQIKNVKHTLWIGTADIGLYRQCEFDWCRNWDAHTYM